MTIKIPKQKSQNMSKLDERKNLHETVNEDQMAAVIRDFGSSLEMFLHNADN